MGSLNYARFPFGKATQYPSVELYENAVSYLRYELAAAEAESPGVITQRVINLRSQLEAYRSTLRRLRWRLHRA